LRDSHFSIDISPLCNVPKNARLFFGREPAQIVRGEAISYSVWHDWHFCSDTWQCSFLVIRFVKTLATHVSDHSFYTLTMPRRFKRAKRSRRFGRRSAYKKRRNGGKTIIKGSRYGNGFARPVKLSIPRAGFPAIMHTTLRFCGEFVLNPAEGVPGSLDTLSYKVLSTNSLVAPHVASYSTSSYFAHDTEPTSPCYMGHEDYSKIYSNYRVSGTSLRLTAQPEFIDSTIGGMPPVPTYVTCQVANEVPGSEAGGTSHDALTCMRDFDSMRAAGRRYLKIDPNTKGVSGAGIGGTRRVGRLSRQAASLAWSSKYVKKTTNPEEVQATVQNRPKFQQYYVISCIPARNPLADPSRKNPIPVRIQYTLEAKVVYWRQRGFVCMPVLENITLPQPDDTDPL